MFGLGLKRHARKKSHSSGSSSDCGSDGEKQQQQQQQTTAHVLGDFLLGGDVHGAHDVHGVHGDASGRHTIIRAKRRKRPSLQNLDEVL